MFVNAPVDSKYQRPSALAPTPAPPGPVLQE